MIEKFSLFEGQFLLWVQENIRNDFFTPAVCFITKTKVMVALWALAVILMFAFKKTRKASVATGGATVLSYLTCNLLLKNLFGRARPFTLIEGLTVLTKLPTDASFPSGHSSLCFACATAVFILLPKKFGIPALVYAVAIALTRLYVGVHFPSDVFCGMLTGILCGAVSVLIYSKIFGSKEEGCTTE